MPGMTKRSPEDTEARINQLRTRGDTLYVGLAAVCLAGGGIAFAKGVISVGLVAFMLTAAFIVARYQDAQYANQLERDEKRRVAQDHLMKVVKAVGDKLDETMAEQRKVIERFQESRCADDVDES